MATISKENNFVTLINVFTVEPHNQKRLIELLVEATETTMKDIEGFISANIHQSIDGTRVINYAQWRSREDFEAMVKNPKALTHMKPIAKIARFDYHLYEITYTNSRDGVTNIQESDRPTTFINVISTTPDQQQGLLEFVIENDREGFSTDPAYHCANFHRSLDGERIVNYSQWDSEEAFLEAFCKLVGLPSLNIEKANQVATAGAKGLGQTDFRFYKVVYTANVMS